MSWFEWSQIDKRPNNIIQRILDAITAKLIYFTLEAYHAKDSPKQNRSIKFRGAAKILSS